MRRTIFASTAVMLAVLASGIVASTSVGVSTASAAELASKTTFCGANDSIDRAGANVNSSAGFLKVIEQHKSDFSAMEKNLPSGTLGTEARDEIAAAQAAIASGNVNDLNNIPSSASGDIDTYCGVNGNGQTLPSYFGKGKATAFCSTFVPIYQAVSNAPNAAGVLAALTSHQAQVSQLASELSTLPKSIKAKATATVDTAQTVITTKNPALVKGNGNGPASHVALYCGQNQ